MAKIVTARGKVYDCLVTETKIDYGYFSSTRSSFQGDCLGPPQEKSDKEFALEVLGLKTTPADLVRILFQAYFDFVPHEEPFSEYLQTWGWLMQFVYIVKKVELEFLRHHQLFDHEPLLFGQGYILFLLKYPLLDGSVGL
jgi:hypothetical protein